MMTTIALTINDTPVEVPKGTTVLQAADCVEICIPRLCSHPNLPTTAGLKPVESVYRGEQRFDHDGRDEEFEGCRLCIVQIEGSPEFARACNTPVEQGMVVHTSTPEMQVAEECTACLLAACGEYVIIYTRSREYEPQV
jgi:NADH dehydrogenase/NADH:ubiquinone oxidoreductase subunit G